MGQPDELRSIWTSIAVANFVASSINSYYALTQRVLLSEEVDDYDAGGLEIARLIHGMSSSRDDVTAAWLGMTIAERDFDPAQDPRHLLDPHLFRGAVGLYEQESIMAALDESHLKRPWPSLMNSAALDFMAISMGLEARANKTLAVSYLSLCGTLSSSSVFNQSKKNPNLLVVATLLSRVNSVVDHAAAGDPSRSIGEVHDIYVDHIDDNLEELISRLGSDSSFQALPEWFGEIREKLLVYASAESEQASLHDDTENFEIRDELPMSIEGTQGAKSGEDIVTRLRQLESLLEQNLISLEEYRRQRERMLGEL